MRLLVTLLLVSTLLPGQGAWLGHSHGESTEPADHAARPHVHLHGHSHHGHSHHHHGDQRDVPEPVPASDHDGDAVYVSSVDLLPAVRGAGFQPDLSTARGLWMGSSDSLTSAFHLACRYGLWHGPPDGCPCVAGLQCNSVLRC